MRPLQQLPWRGVGRAHLSMEVGQPYRVKHNCVGPGSCLVRPLGDAATAADAAASTC